MLKKTRKPIDKREYIIRRLNIRLKNGNERQPELRVRLFRVEQISEKLLLLLLDLERLLLLLLIFDLERLLLLLFDRYMDG